MSKRSLQQDSEKPLSAPRDSDVTCLHEDLDRGWAWLVLVASFSSLFVIGGVNFTVGLFHMTLQEIFHASHTRTAWAASIHAALCNLAGPLSGFVADRFSVRTALLLGATFMTTGYLLTAFSPSLELSILTFGVIAGLGQGLTWTSASVATGYYFRKYRSSVIGVANCGTAVGIFGLPPLIQAAKEHFGASPSFIVLCYFTMQMFINAIIIKPSSLELETQRKKRMVSSKGKNQRSVLVTYFKLLTCRPVLCMSLSMFMHCIGVYITYQYLPNYCVQEGTPPVQMSFVVAISGMASILGRMISGFVANLECVSEVVVYGMVIGLTGVCSLTFPLYVSTYTGQLLFAVAFGLFFGSPFTTVTPANIVFVGVSNMAMALGIEIAFGGFGTIVGPVFAGFLLDNGGTYSEVFVMAGIANILGAGFAFLAFFMEKCEPCKSSYIPGDEQEVQQGVKERMVPE